MAEEAETTPEPSVTSAAATTAGSSSSSAEKDTSTVRFVDSSGALRKSLGMVLSDAVEEAEAMRSPSLPDSGGFSGSLTRFDTVTSYDSMIGLPVPPAARLDFGPAAAPGAQKCRVAVLGAGSFGTALAVICARNGHDVCVYARDKSQVDCINTEHMNPKRFADHTLPPNLKATDSVDFACNEFKPHMILHCVPCQFSEKFLIEYKDVIPADKVTYVCTSKGIHLGTKMLMSELIPHCLGYDESRCHKLAYLSGPSFAKEIMGKHPMSVVCASNDYENCRLVQKLMNSVYFRVYASVDVTGVEVGGALKNPLAIGAGMARGLGYGQSTIASIVTRGAVEMKQMALAMGGEAETLNGLSGMGDLMLTCFSSLSRNQRTGYLMGHKQMTADEAQAQIGEVVEGVATASVVLDLIKKHKVRMPLFEATARILAGEISATDALHRIMTRPPTVETPMPMSPVVSPLQSPFASSVKDPPPIGD